MIPAEDRIVAVELIEEAVCSGARCAKACEVLEISLRTYRRWGAGRVRDQRKGAPRAVVRKLSHEEQEEILSVSCSPRFQDMTPYEIVAILAQEGRYIASVSTFYRVLKSAGKVHHRGNSRPGRKSSAPPELAATGPNQVYSWDITYLKTSVAGIFLYAYIVVDVWSRKIVSWTVESEESERHAARLFQNMARLHDLRKARLHSDNGNPMKGSTMLMTLYRLGVIPSFSRPRVHDDNPYSESLFKTLKYTAGYPKCFSGPSHAREWIAEFVDWYNTRHVHSGIGYVTPQQRHEGTAAQILEKRNRVFEEAWKRHPERWSGKRKIWTAPDKVFLNPSEETRKSLQEKSA